MIYLNQNSSNRIIYTATENTTLTGTTYYLFELISDDTRTAKYFVPDNTSTNTCRYDESIITVSATTETLTGSTVSIDLDPVGYGKYNVYQQTSATNLDPSLANGIVETGKYYVSGDTKPTVFSYTGNTETDTDTYIAYE